MLSTQPFRILLLFISFLLAKNSNTQPLIGSLDYKYSKTKYNGSKSSRNRQNSFSYQFLGGLSKEIKDDLRIGAKAGVTLDKVYSGFSRNTPNFSRTNLQAYVGLNIQKRLVRSDKKRVASLWAAAEVAAEPFISRKSLFFLYYPTDTIPENTTVYYNGVYIDKKTRFTITPSLKMEIKITNAITVTAQAGYAIDVGKSNQTAKYRTNIYTLTNFPELVTKNVFRENYLFAGAGFNYKF